MRIALIGFDPGEYGVQVANSIADLAEVLLVAPRSSHQQYVRKLHPKVHRYIFDAPRLRQALRQVPAMYDVRRAITRFRPDVIHMQHTHLWFDLMLPTLRRYPLVITVHDPVHHEGDTESARNPQRIVHWGYRQADALITHAPQLASVLVESVGVPADRVTVIPHIAQRTGPVDTRFGERGHTVLFFGRIWPYKGLEYLIKAEPLVSERIADVRFVIAGRGEDFGRYKAMIVNPERFTIDNDFISDDDADRYFAESSVVALPYVDASQSGVVPIASFFGRPVVATTVGGLPAVVDDGVTGLLVPPRDSRALADALVRLLNNDELRHKMGAAARRKLDTEWAPEVVGPKHIEVYQAARRRHDEHRPRRSVSPLSR